MKPETADLASGTQALYLDAVRNLASDCRRSPDDSPSEPVGWASIRTVPDPAINSRRRVMWAGMTSNDYTTVDGKVLHQPTGLTLQWPAAVQWTVTPGPYVLAPAPPARWLAADLYITEIPNGWSAQQMKLPNDASDDYFRFRRRFGSLRKVERIFPRADAGGPVPWNADLIRNVANLFFVSTDLSGYALGHPAFPDKLEFVAPGLPAALRQTLVNPFARPVT
jgi:hypothetical protein